MSAEVAACLPLTCAGLESGRRKDAMRFLFRAWGLVLATACIGVACGNPPTPAGQGLGAADAGGGVDGALGDGGTGAGDSAAVDAGQDATADTAASDSGADAAADTGANVDGKTDATVTDATVTDSTVTDAADAKGDAGDTKTDAADTQSDATDAGKDGGGPGGSCVGNCGSSAGGCFCDSLCKGAGDCCADFDAVCGCSKDSDCQKGPVDKCEMATCEEGLCEVAAKACDDDNPCMVNSCDPATGNCKAANLADGKGCDPGVNCKAGVCAKGVCKGTASLADGDDCSDGDECTVDDACKTGACVPGPPDDCDDDDSCTNDVCDKVNGCDNLPVSGTPPCDDDEACTTGDKCDQGTCTGTEKPDGASCNDGDACTEKDECNSGFCSGGDAPDGTVCDDGDLCTTKDVCDAGYCDGTATVCNDGNACTFDDCDDKNGKCAAEAKSDGSTCDDGNPCTEDEACKVGACKAPVGAGACDDGNACTTDSCSAVGGKADCKHAAIGDGGACDDGDLCTDSDVCKTGKCAGTAGKCTSLHSDALDCGKAVGWLFNPASAVGKPGWSIDGTPSLPVAKSGACSLNFNNGKSYEGTGKVTGTATSAAAIVLPAGAKVHLGFWNYHDVEGSNSYDKRHVLVSADGFATTPVKLQLDNATKPKQWTYVTVVLDALAGNSVLVRFEFDSVDGLNNTGTGWFVDDLVVNKSAP